VCVSSCIQANHLSRCLVSPGTSRLSPPLDGLFSTAATANRQQEGELLVVRLLLLHLMTPGCSVKASGREGELQVGAQAMLEWTPKRFWRTTVRDNHGTASQFDIVGAESFLREPSLPNLTWLAFPLLQNALTKELTIVSRLRPATEPSLKSARQPR
jgi:hypothetical protein